MFMLAMFIVTILGLLGIYWLIATLEHNEDKRSIQQAKPVGKDADYSSTNEGYYRYENQSYHSGEIV